MKKLITILFAVFYVVSWKGWEAKIENGNAVMKIVERSVRQETKENAIEYAKDLEGAPHLYWDIQIKRVEETEVGKQWD